MFLVKISALERKPAEGNGDRAGSERSLCVPPGGRWLSEVCIQLSWQESEEGPLRAGTHGRVSGEGGKGVEPRARPEAALRPPAPAAARWVTVQGPQGQENKLGVRAVGSEAEAPL